MNPPGRGGEDDDNLIAFNHIQDPVFDPSCPSLGQDGMAIAHSLQASMGHHGHSSPRGDGADNLVVASPLRTNGQNSSPERSDQTLVLAFDERQITSPGNRSNPQPGDPCPTLNNGSGMTVASDMLVRRLLPVECERLMAWPDDWTRWADDGREIPDSHRYRLIGNGVVSNVAEWIGRRLVAVDAMLGAQDAA